MRAENNNNINARNPLGKGEVVSSILTGSTTNPHEMGTSGDAPEAYSAVGGRTEREPDTSSRGKSVESVRASLLAWAEGKPPEIRQCAARLADQIAVLSKWPESQSIADNVRRSFRELERLNASSDTTLEIPRVRQSGSEQEAAQSGVARPLSSQKET